MSPLSLPHLTHNFFYKISEYDENRKNNEKIKTGLIQTNRKVILRRASCFENTFRFLKYRLKREFLLYK